MRHHDSEFRNILVIHLGQLGDVVLGLPALQAIRERFADAKITLLLGKATGEIARLARVSDDQILVDRVLLRDGNKVVSIAKIFALVREVRSHRFDLVIDLHSLPETNLLGAVSGAKYRLYANRESRSLDWLSTYTPKPPGEDKTKHAAERYFDVVKPLGIESVAPAFRFRPDDNDLAYIRDRFFSGQVLEFSAQAGLFPGAGNPSRCWSFGNFAALATRLANAGVRPVVFLGPEEVGLKSEIAKRFPPETLIVDGLTISRFIAAVSTMDVFVGNDTGPVHLAACTGVPITLLLDERAPTTYLPLTDRLKVVTNRTIDLIGIDETYEATDELLKRYLKAEK